MWWVKKKYLKKRYDGNLSNLFFSYYLDYINATVQLLLNMQFNRSISTAAATAEVESLAVAATAANAEAPAAAAAATASVESCGVGTDSAGCCGSDGSCSGQQWLRQWRRVPAALLLLLQRHCGSGAGRSCDSYSSGDDGGGGGDSSNSCGCGAAAEQQPLGRAAVRRTA